MPDLYRKRPVVVQTMLLTAENAKDVCDWVHAASAGKTKVGYDDTGTVIIDTLEGVMRANVGWWIIQGVAGEFYPCEPRMFERTYAKFDLEAEARDLYHRSSLARETFSWWDIGEIDREHFRDRVRETMNVAQ